MKIIEPSVTLLEKPEDQTNETEVLKYLEKIGRVCYRSEDKITEDSAKKFFLMLKNRGHWAMLEHYLFTVYMDMEVSGNVFVWNGKGPRYIDIDSVPLDKDNCPFYDEIDDIPLFKRFKDKSVCRAMFSPRAYLERVETLDIDLLPDNLDFVGMFHNVLWNNWPTIFSDQKPDHTYFNETLDNYVFVPNGGKFQRDDLWHSIEFVTNRGVSHELCRHRIASFAQESTRYCNYSKTKFGNELTFIKQEFPGLDPYNKYMDYDDILRRIEMAYMDMINHDVSPQIARSILPNSLATKIVMTAKNDEWEHFFKLRCAPEAHPDMQVVAKMARYLLHQKE